MIRLFSTIVHVMNPEGTKTLFLNHRKLGKWLPPGGKVDPNEIPDDAAVREVLEETGIRVQLVGKHTPGKGGLMCPYGMQLNVIRPGELEHIDFIYCSLPLDSDEPKVNEREAAEVRWFTIDEIIAPDFNTFPETKEWIKFFSQEVKRANFSSERF